MQKKAVFRYLIVRVLYDASKKFTYIRDLSNTLNGFVILL